jgi:hypothetical protein
VRWPSCRGYDPQQCHAAGGAVLICDVDLHRLPSGHWIVTLPLSRLPLAVPSLRFISTFSGSRAVGGAPSERRSTQLSRETDCASPGHSGGLRLIHGNAPGKQIAAVAVTVAERDAEQPWRNQGTVHGGDRERHRHAVVRSQPGKRYAVYNLVKSR